MTFASRPGPMLLIVATAGWTTACGGDSASRPAGSEGSAVVRRDSAGVEVVETPRALWSEADALIVDPEPELAIGLIDGEAPYVFGSVAGALRLSDGTIAIADGQALEIRLFDANGRFLRSVGGRGQGPGEFDRFVEIRSCGEGLVHAFDVLRRRVSVWGRGGALEREFELPDPGPDASSRAPYRSACSSSGEFVVASWSGIPVNWPPTGEPELYTHHSSVWLLDADGRPLRELGEYPVQDRIESPLGGSGPHPFGRRLSLALEDGRVYLGTSERLEVLVLARDGTLLQVWRGPSEDLSVDGGVVAGYRAAQGAGLDAPGVWVVPLIDQLGDAGLPAGLPAYTDLRLDPTGRLWVERFRFPWEGAGRWGVFSPDGAFLGHVELPEGFSALEFGSDHVLGTHRDSLGVEQVRLHRLRPEGRAP